MTDKSTRIILAWCLYDWALAAFSVIVTTFVFATYFTSSVAEDKIIGTYQWANAMALAGVIIAFTSPIFGAIADRGGQHRQWLSFFTIICAISSALLWFAYPHPHSVYWMLACIVIGNVGLELASVFYNAYLPHIVKPAYLGRISGFGWGSGYLGGIVALSFVLIVFLNHDWLSLDKSTFANVRIAGPFVALWIMIFSLPLFWLAPRFSSQTHSLSQAVRLGIREWLSTLKSLHRDKNMLLYLIAHMIYTDGLNTLFAFGGIYAAGTYGMSFQEVMLFGITMNITAGVGAIVLGWADDWIGPKACVIASLCCMVLFGVPILLLEDKYTFWAIALMLSVFVGPVQAASRSLLVRLIDKSVSAEMFGLYSLSGKITAFIGPWLLGVTTWYFASQRAGMATILVFFFLGGILMLWVKVPVAVSLAIPRKFD